VDPATGTHVNLFNPRAEKWNEHFVLESDGRIVGLTPAGRATIRSLDMNGSPQLDLRREILEQRVFPE
jgi:hypothetical protein